MDSVRHAAAERDHEPRAGRDELQHVEIAGQDRDVDVLRLGLAHERRDDVVGLVALDVVGRDVERLDDLADLRDLIAQVVGHAHPVRLVLGVGLVPERPGGQVEGDRDVVRADVRRRPGGRCS